MKLKRKEIRNSNLNKIIDDGIIPQSKWIRKNIPTNNGIKNIQSFTLGNECIKYYNYDFNLELKVNEIGIDAEWFDDVEHQYEKAVGLETSFITKQATLTTDKGKVHIILWDSLYKLPCDMDVLSITDEPIILVKTVIQDLTIHPIVKMLNIKYDKLVPIFMYYAPLDLLNIMTVEQLKLFLENGLITKKRNINANFDLNGLLNENINIPDELDFEFDDETDEPKEKVKFKIYDLIGSFNSTLDKAFDSQGMENPYKDLIPANMKGKMNEVIVDNPTTFLKYAMGDTMFISDLWKSRVNQINTIVYEALGLDTGYDTINCPRTSGALVSDVMMKWMGKTYPELLIAVETLATPSSKKADVHKSFLEAIERKDNLKNGSISMLKPGNKKPSIIEADKLYKMWDSFKGGGISGLACASIGALGGLSNNNSSLNAIVNGGRCNNENHLNYLINNVFDIDLSSCYGTALGLLDYPVGKPSIIGSDNNIDEILTLETFIKKYIESKKIGIDDGMWQIIVENPKNVKGKTIPFDFEQDLVYSKLEVSPESIRKDLLLNDTDDNEESDGETIVDKTHVNAVFKLLRNEIKNGVITSHSLEVLKKTSSNKEWSQIKKLVVVAGAYYSRKNKVSIEEFVNITSNRKTRGGFKLHEKNQNLTIDNRTEVWCSFPLKDFIGNFISYRAKLKARRNENTIFETQQEAVKLFINTLYGCLASPFFPISNAILANNITDKARVGAWMMNKSLGTVQSITDGGAYSNSGVRYMKTELSRFQKPSLNVLANYERLNKDRYVKIGNLVDDFELFYDEAKNNLKGKHKELDILATEHINEFWKPYDLKIAFDIEHKESNTCKTMVYTNASDYLFIEPLEAKYTIFVNDYEIQDIVKYGSTSRCAEWSEQVNYSVKVRGAKQDDHPKKKWLFYLAGIIKKFNPIFNNRTLIGVNQYINYLKYSTDWTENLVCGETLVKEQEIRPGTNHFPLGVESEYTNLKRYKGRRQKTHEQRKDKLNIYYGIYEDLPELLDSEEYRDYLKQGGDSQIFTEQGYKYR